MKILIATTSSDMLAPGHPTGTWLEEFAVPYRAFMEAGAAVVVASPKGGRTPIDPQTNPNDEQKRTWAAAISALESTSRLTDENAAEFDALFIPGGHGPMVDLATDKDIARLLTDFDRSGKIIGAVCHGPAAFINALGADGRPLVAGKRISGFTNNEEKLVHLDSVVPFMLETELKEKGASFDGTPIPFAPHTVRDGNLITGQNPASSSAIANKMLDALRIPDAV